MSSVNRFHQPAFVAPDTRPKLLRKRKPRPKEQRMLLASDQNTLTDSQGTWPIELYRERIVGRAITLTRKEADLIVLANPGIERPEVLEDMHPWLPARPFLNNSAASYEILESTIKSFGHHLVSAVEFTDQKWNTVCNSIRMKNDLDARFYTAWHLPIQDAWVLEERRAGRSVVAIDCNAMYSACMQQLFPRPSGLRLVTCNRQYTRGENLAPGLYRCVVNNPSVFIRRHNPFRTFFCGRHLGVDLSEPLEVDLNEFEVVFYSRHFGSIHLVEAVVSEETVVHPLAKEVRRAFARRCNYQAQNNKALANREKYLSTLMASCAARPKRFRKTFRRKDVALEYLRSEYGVSAPADEPEIATDSWLDGRKGIQLRTGQDGASLDAPTLHDGSACFLLGQRTVAMGRIRLLEMMEKVLSSGPSIEICYANIDSIHFSLPSVHLDEALAILAPDLSANMGAFKVEAITRHGLWLEPGRYWLYSDIVEKFRNRSVGDRATPFKDHTIHVVTRRIGDLHIPIRVTLKMDKTMSDLRSLYTADNTELTRQQLVESGSKVTFSDVLDQLTENRTLSIPTRLRAFRALQKHL